MNPRSLALLFLIATAWNCTASQAQELGDPSIGLTINEDKIRANRIRKISGKHLTLFTDLPASKEVDELTKVFDLAVGNWQKYFAVKAVDDFHAVCFLMKERSHFVRAGVMPRALPNFKNGYTLGKKSFWMYEQPSDYMRRQLLIHEGTHAFLFSKFNPTIPSWFNEGLAELFGGHRWSDGKLETGITIAGRDEAPYWGRSRLIREKVAAGTIPTVDEIRKFSSSAFLKVEPYAWVWALTSFLDTHPEFGPGFRKLATAVEGHSLVDSKFDKMFAKSRSRMNEQWNAFLADLDYGVNGDNSAIQYEEAKIARNDLRTILASRSWQNSGIEVVAGKNYLIRSKGRFVIRKSKVSGKLTDWPCEPNGVTLEYFRGAPLGKLVMVIQPKDANVKTDFFKPIAVGLSKPFKPSVSGKLFFRVNESPSGLHDNSGEFLVSVVETD